MLGTPFVLLCVWRLIRMVARPWLIGRLVSVPSLPRVLKTVPVLTGLVPRFCLAALALAHTLRLGSPVRGPLLSGCLQGLRKLKAAIMARGRDLGDPERVQVGRLELASRWPSPSPSKSKGMQMSKGMQSRVLLVEAGVAYPETVFTDAYGKQGFTLFSCPMVADPEV